MQRHQYIFTVSFLVNQPLQKIKRKPKKKKKLLFSTKKLLSLDDDWKSKQVENNQKINNIKNIPICLNILSFFLYIYI